ncbi:MAG TPA: cell division protein SepF [Methanocella sp.]|nr:cell division protein SepF [Methanocella sp.]
MAGKGFLSKVLGSKPASENEEYTEIDFGAMEQQVGSGPAETYVRVAELSGLGQIPELKREIYNGNIVVVDITLIKSDNLTRDRALKDLKQVAADVRGDIAGIGDHMIIVTPMSIKVDRTKFTGK